MLDKNNHYSPLPQALSDDEDEYKHSTSNGIEMDRVYNMNHVNGESPTPLISVHLNDGKALSWPRKIYFILSVSVACFVVLSFLWFLPCDVGYAPCRSSKAFKMTPNWNTVMPSKAFRAGLIQLVDADKDGRMDIIIGYRKMNGKISFAEALETSSYTAGVIVLRGYDGKKIWEQQYHAAPSDILCNEIDVNQDGVNDCILVGDLGLFSAIKIANDYTFWSLHDHVQKLRRPVDVSIPAVVPDLDGDDIDDLVITCHMGKDLCSYCPNSSVSYLLIISGQTGEIVGNHLPLPDCPEASKPVAININGSIHLILHCKSANESVMGSVYIVDLENLKDYALQNAADEQDTILSVISLLYRFQGEGSHVHLITDDLDMDKSMDILLVGGDGEVAVYKSSSMTLKWSYQNKGYDVVSCTVGLTIEDKFKVVLLTFLLQNCSEECFTTIVALSGSNGSELWHYSRRSVTSPIVLPKSNIWQHLVAFKGFEKSFENDTMALNNSSERALDYDENISREDDKTTRTVAFDEKLLVLNSEFEVQEKMLQRNTNMCLGLTKYLPDCLPAFGFHASSAVGDFDGDQRADLISITTFVDFSTNSWNLQVTKTNLGTEEETSTVHHFHTFE